MTNADTYSPVDHVGVSLGDDRVLRLTLDKPDKRNALDDDMVAALIDRIDAAGRDEAVRAVLIDAAGDHFCSGFDIVGRNKAKPDGGQGSTDGQKPRIGTIQRRLPSQAHRLIPVLCSVQVPIVCAVRGWVAGIGLHLAAAADITVVATDATIWEPFSQRGFTPDSGATWLLPRLVGPQRARRLLLRGERISGSQAVDWGLFTEAADAADVSALAERTALELAGGPTVTLGLTKHLLASSSTATLDEQLQAEAFAIELSSRSEDFKEGLAAFAQKRDPKFSGR
jgi:2-(1,2-epoxy-1,2-dihydrophenyl)acetyl-CoA isomerase